MTKRAKVRAAGAVVLRGEGDDQEVLLIHRQRYDDWSLPKGKGKVDELSPATAVREVLEETGYVVRLGLRLPTIRYNVSRGPKSVEYWRAVVVEEREFVPNDEVD
ncbi:MAG TPA: NUDIX domain-containing protein, partial [Arachnia sp.]|nr:NUDIX domain-containing protein [Arachnia sp.]